MPFFPSRSLCASGIALLISILSHQIAWSASAPKYESVIRELSAAAEAEVRAGNISGVTSALVEDQQIIFARGFGFADKKHRISSAPDTVYRAGSISKLFTAVAAMQLAEQGKLSIDQPVTNYLPEFRIIDPPPPGAPRVDFEVTP